MADVHAPRFVDLVNESLPHRSRSHYLNVLVVTLSADQARAEVVLEIVDDRTLKQVWDVAIPIDPIDLTLNDQALATVLRANLDEWDDTRAHEPELAAWGTPRLRGG